MASRHSLSIVASRISASIHLVSSSLVGEHAHHWKVVKEILSGITLKNGKPALALYGGFAHLRINPFGQFIVGGPQGGAGLTGRKITIGTDDH